MREIKFRAWDGKKIHKVCRLGLNGFSTDLWSNGPEACDVHFTDALKIMQYTGLKDKNGKEIYEGDIVSEARGATMGMIVYDNMHAAFGYRTKASWIPPPGFWGEIIGNIYETPELLKEAK